MNNRNNVNILKCLSFTTSIIFGLNRLRLANSAKYLQRTLQITRSLIHLKTPIAVPRLKYSSFQYFFHRHLKLYNEDNMQNKTYLLADVNKEN